MHLFFFAYNLADPLKLGTREPVFFFDPRAECLSYDWFFLIIILLSFYFLMLRMTQLHLRASGKEFFTRAIIGLGAR